MEKIAAVVVTYNRCELLRECLNRVLAQRNASCDVLVIDNFSTDETPSVVSSILDQRIHYRNTGKNIGGAGGFNVGMRWAVELGYERVWLMDDDSLPEPDALAMLLEADACIGGEYGFLSSAVMWKDGSGCIMNKPLVSTKYEEQLGLLQHGIIRVEQATFVSMLIKADTICRYGLPIAEFFIWADDMEYSRRLSVRNSLPCYLVGKSHTLHMMDSNVGSNISTDRLERIDRYRLAFRNECYLFRKEGLRGVRYYIVRCLAAIKNILLKSRSYRLRRLRALTAGIVSGIFFHPKVEYISPKED